MENAKSPSFASVVTNTTTPSQVANSSANELGNERGAEAMYERVHGEGVTPPTADDTTPMEVDPPTPPASVEIDNANAEIGGSANSWVVREPVCKIKLNTKKGKEAMRLSLPSAVRTQLDQDFGKDDNNHSFTNDATFRHILLPLYSSNYLDDNEWFHLRMAVPCVERLGRLIDDVAEVDFRPLRENFFPDGWDTATDFNHERTRMLTACLLFYKGSVAALVRYVGGPFVGDHRDVPKILNNIRGKVPQHVYNDIERIFTTGAPTFCNASSTDENLQTYLKYGNHTSATDETIIRKTMLKDEKRGHVIMLDDRLTEFVLHAHVCPVALADLVHEIKTPRFIYDASFHPTPPSLTCNDWTNKSNEPELEFPAAYMTLLVWMWNMRISNPRKELYGLDDDVVAAFRTVCWHPNLVSMHGLRVLGHLWFMARLTFGDCSSPPNFEPIAIARRWMAKYYYNLPNVVELAAKHMPNIQVVTPSEADIASIMQIPPDSKNPGMISVNGQAADTPPYVHHVDDNLYGSLEHNIHRAVAASILGLFAVVGEPVDTQPHPFSYEKFDLVCNHIRKITGVMINTRTMTLWYPDYKRKQLVDLLAKWIHKDFKKFTIKQALELQGVLMDASRFNTWGRVQFFILQNVISNCLRQRYHVALRYRKIDEEKVKKELESYRLTKADEKRFTRQGCNQLYAKYVYKHNHRTDVSKRLHAELKYLHDYLADFANPWQINIGHVIERDPVSRNVGDSSFHGVGFWSDEFKVICMLPTCASITHRCDNLNAKHASYLSQNTMEFITAVIDFACSVTILEHESCAEMRRVLFPNGVPPVPRVASLKDNRVSESWIKKGASGAIHGQQLLRINAEIGHDSSVKQDGDRIIGDDNHEADMLSRPDKPLYRKDRDILLGHFEKILEKFPRFVNYKVFVPSSNLLDAIAWALRPKDQVDRTAIRPPPLVQPYGHFVTPDEYKVNVTFIYDV